MAAFALPIPNPDQTMADIADMMRWLLEQPGMAQWIGDGTPEQEILDEDGNFVRADLAVHYPAYSVVLEYKTGANDSMLPEPAHMRQLLRYMRLTSAARNRPTRGFLAYLDRRLLFEASGLFDENSSPYFYSSSSSRVSPLSAMNEKKYFS